MRITDCVHIIENSGNTEALRGFLRRDPAALKKRKLWKMNVASSCTHIYTTIVVALEHALKKKGKEKVDKLSTSLAT